MPPWDGDLGDLPRPGRGDWLRLSASDYYQVPPQAPPNWHTVEFHLCPPQALRNLAADGIVLDAVCRVENPMAEWRRGLNGLVEVHPSRLPEYYFGPVHAVERDEESISVLVPRPRGRHVTFRPEVDPERFELLWVTIWSWSRNLMGRGTLVPVASQAISSQGVDDDQDDIRALRSRRLLPRVLLRARREDQR